MVVAKVTLNGTTLMDTTDASKTLASPGSFNNGYELVYIY